MDGRWRIELLGGLRAVQGDRTITRFRTQKTGILLAYLAYHRHRVHRREELIELLWPERDPSAGRNSLSTEFAWLRRALQPGRVESPELRVPSRDREGAERLSPCPPLPHGRGSEPSTVIVTDRASVRLNPAAVTTDVAAFKTALRSAARAESGAERANLPAHLRTCERPVLRDV